MHLSSQKTQLNQGIALVMTFFILLIYWLIIRSIPMLPDTAYLILLLGGALVGYNFYSIFTKKYRERQALVHTPFPQTWRTILEQNVTYYRSLNDADKARFETEIQIFLHETRVTGIQTEVDDTTLVLVGASAIIPVFSFPEWEYENLGEVLIYPRAFTRDFRLEGPGRTVQGMVGTGVMNGVMILSKPALLAGFKVSNDKQNVGIHEFVHLLDAADGEYDGIAERFLERAYIAPWVKLMHEEMARIEAGTSTLRHYGSVSPVEFFSVAAEYFFEHPRALEKDHPELYALLQRVFQQNTRAQLKKALRDTLNYNGTQIGRNAPCPCNSGKKYKKCCLHNARQYQQPPAV